MKERRSNRAGIRMLVLGAVGAAAAIGAARCFADNPIVQTCFTADPAPMVYDDTVYLYTSHDEDDARGFKMLDWQCFTSKDMVNWTDQGAIASMKSFTWTGDNGAWAAQCILRNGKFYFYCPVARRNGGMAIGVAVADNPLGPFKDAIGKPLIANSREDIDPTVFIDDDGQAYLYWGNPNLYYVKLNEDMISYSGEIVRVPTKPRNYQEGPWLYKRDGNYYMAYASTCCPEGIGYCHERQPHRPVDVQGNDHGRESALLGEPSGNHRLQGQHVRLRLQLHLNIALTNVHRERRSVCVAKLSFNDDGSIPKLPFWSKEGVDQVGTFNPYAQTDAATICWETGVETEARGGDRRGVYVTVNENDAYIKVKGVDFGDKGAAKFQASVASATGGGAIVLRLDSETGPVVGTLEVKATGDPTKWETQSCGVEAEGRPRPVLHVPRRREVARELRLVEVRIEMDKGAKTT